MTAGNSQKNPSSRILVMPRYPQVEAYLPAATEGGSGISAETAASPLGAKEGTAASPRIGQGTYPKHCSEKEQCCSHAQTSAHSQGLGCIMVQQLCCMDRKDTQRLFTTLGKILSSHYSVTTSSIISFISGRPHLWVLFCLHGLTSLLIPKPWVRKVSIPSAGQVADDLKVGWQGLPLQKHTANFRLHCTFTTKR